MDRPVVDEEFQSCIFPITDIEYQQLEKNILAEGIRDVLVTWNGILLDGHNRLSIAEKHGLTYQTKEISLADRGAAKEWIVLNQLGRRNLTPQQMSYERGKLYELRKKVMGETEAINTLIQVVKITTWQKQPKK